MYSVRSGALKLSIASKAHINSSNLKLCGRCGVHTSMEEIYLNDVSAIDLVQSKEKVSLKVAHKKVERITAG